MENLDSTKNESDACGSEMHQTKKGNNEHFSIRARIGGDADSGLIRAKVKPPFRVMKYKFGYRQAVTKI